MNCDCISRTENAVAEKFSAEVGADIKATCMGTGFLLHGSSLAVCINTTFKLTGSAKGYTRGKEINMIASFCPFCGESTKPGETSKAAEAKSTVPLQRCAAGRDGDCSHDQCPQIRDGEPAKSGRHCPLDTGAEYA
ncbi:gp41 [Pandoraea sputorum]|nr:gp41 [Pandoraea sputorum]